MELQDYLEQMGLRVEYRSEPRQPDHCTVSCEIQNAEVLIEDRPQPARACGTTRTDADTALVRLIAGNTLQSTFRPTALYWVPSHLISREKSSTKEPGEDPMDFKRWCILMGAPLLMRVFYGERTAPWTMMGTHVCYLDPEHCTIFVGGKPMSDNPLGLGMNEEDAMRDLVTTLRAIVARSTAVVRCRSVIDGQEREFPIPSDLTT